MWIPVESMPMNTPRNSAEVKPGEVVSVSWLNRAARNVLEESFPLMWIAGEVSTLTRAASGHVYFTLKDEQAQVRCTMWRNRAQLLPFRLEHGMQVEVRALVSLIEDDQGGYGLAVELHAQLPGIERAQGQRIMDEAHKTCPYSKALRGDNSVKLVVD